MEFSNSFDLLHAVSSFTRYMHFYPICHLFENCSSPILIGNGHANDTFRRKHLNSQLERFEIAREPLFDPLSKRKKNICIISR